MSKDLAVKIKETVAYLNSVGVVEPEVGVILGSGLNDYADRIDDAIVMSYNDIPHMQAGSVSDHRGQLVYGTYMDKKVVLLAGRFHY